ncbi:hypothetical protein NQD34_009985 [Periophthalmus magnuspinnatus]|nr:hypothetical protein NQD34_009985 [Periophthalmus magnuspinnatus]
MGDRWELIVFRRTDSFLLRHRHSHSFHHHKLPVRHRSPPLLVFIDVHTVPLAPPSQTHSHNPSGTGTNRITTKTSPQPMISTIVFYRFLLSVKRLRPKKALHKCDISVSLSQGSCGYNNNLPPLSF